MEAAFNAFDPDLYVATLHSRPEKPIDNTARPDEESATQRGYHFEPLNLEERDPDISTIASQAAAPVDLFLQFLPEKIVEKWVQYINEAADRYSRENHDFSRSWKPVNLAEVYLFIGIIIYIGLHREADLRSYWAANTFEKFLPDHPISRLMTRDRFFQLFRRVRIYNEAALDPTESHDPLNYQKVDEYSNFLQNEAISLWKPGLRVAVDECIIGYKGRSKITLTIPSKPDPTGFKVWAIAQEGYFLRWLFHTPSTTFGPAAGDITRQPPRELEEKSLNPTQSVVVTLVNLLLSASYHVFMDNLFSSPSLFRILQDQGISATGTARVNSGIHEDLVSFKKADNEGKLKWAWGKYQLIPTPDDKVRVFKYVTPHISPY
ncbi:hypothetical protein H9Q69_007677 [Fusarium xylarioides]|nr:hypothetical protein H9Q69_007677 [Fusarium xylarioides]